MAGQTSKAVDLITEEIFREAYSYEEPWKIPLKKRIAQALKCTRQTPFQFFPFARWICKYNVKKDLLYDVAAGVTVAIMHIPHGLSYAPLGGVAPVVGFYMAIFPVFIYMFLGTSHQISIGTFAVVCSMTGNLVSHFQETLATNATTNNSTLETFDALDLYKHNGTGYSNTEVGMAVCLMVGIWQAAMGLLRLGIFTVVMSDSMVSGFTTAAAFYVFTYQLKNLFGIKVASGSGMFKLIYTYIDFFSKIQNTNLVTISLSLACILVLILFNEVLKPLISRKFPKNKIPIPIELIVIIIGILVSYSLNLSEKYNVKIVEYIPEGFPIPRSPPFSIFPKLFFPSFMVAIVAIAVNLSLAKMFARKCDYSISPDQEMIAYGAANIFASFFLCIPSAASLSRSSLQYSTGGKTQLASIFSIAVIIIIILFAGPLFEPVPYCVLSSVVVVTLKGLLFQIFEAPKIWKRNYWDGIVWIVTFFVAVIVDLELGLLVGILVSWLSLTCFSISVRVSETGKVRKQNVFLDNEYFKAADEIPGILILKVSGNLNFANQNKFEEKVLKKFNDFILKTEGKCYSILHMGGISIADPGGIETLKQLNKKFLKSNCILYLTDCNVKVYKALEKCNFFTEFPREQVLATISDAVEYLMSLS